MKPPFRDWSPDCRPEPAKNGEREASSSHLPQTLLPNPALLFDAEPLCGNNLAQPSLGAEKPSRCSAI
jgi:hypothetical protein